MKSSNPQKFRPIFRRLKSLFSPYERHLVVASNTATLYNLVGPSGKNRAKRFGGVAIRDNKVTFYSCPELLKAGSPALRTNMSGTSSVDFTEMNEPVIRELEALTAKRFKGYQDNGTF